MIICKFRQDACDAYCNIAKQHDFCNDEENCPVFKLQEENEELKKQIDCYKAFESHYDEIEEDAKAIAKENEELKEQIEQMKCCGNCQSVF